MTSQRSDYTFKHNRSLGRHQWLRLTPAYSVKLVREIIEDLPKGYSILDPFSGTATTGIAAAEFGYPSTLFDINPFLVWFGNLKLTNLKEDEAIALRTSLHRICSRAAEPEATDNLWFPPIRNIERWWNFNTLNGLARIRSALINEIGDPVTSNIFALLWIAFARVAIEYSAAAFNHVSVSFHNATKAHSLQEIIPSFEHFAETFIADAVTPLEGKGTVFLHDSSEPFSENIIFDALITSPPYPNRISYIRELRPYMFWLGFLREAREAGELDWRTIGGTWGIATSRLTSWEPSHECAMKSLQSVTKRISESNGKNGKLLSLYVEKYFYDMDRHIRSVRHLLQPGAEVHYIIGNSSFYGIHVATPKLYEESLRAHGFRNVESRIIRKRNSKRELFEYCTSATLGDARRSRLAHITKAGKESELTKKYIQMDLLEPHGFRKADSPRRAG